MSQLPPNLYPPDLVNQLRIFAALAEFRLSYDRGCSLSKHPGTSVPSVPMPIFFGNIPANLRLPLYWIEESGSPIPNGGIVAGEIIGHRCWRLHGRTTTLLSMAVDCLWLPSKVVEGNVEHYLGVHAFKSKMDAMRYGKQHSSSTIVFGTIKMWGDVVEHERGWRAQYARIHSIDDSTRERSILPKLREIYGVNSQ